ncbi:hypothetical protein LguiA_010150 [Lonicera macranthoides]
MVKNATLNSFNGYKSKRRRISIAFGNFDELRDCRVRCFASCVNLGYLWSFIQVGPQ